MVWVVPGGQRTGGQPVAQHRRRRIGRRVGDGVGEVGRDLGLAEGPAVDADLVDGAGEVVGVAGAEHPGTDLERCGEGGQVDGLRGAVEGAVDVGPHGGAVVGDGDVGPGVGGKSGAELEVGGADVEPQLSGLEVEVTIGTDGHDGLVGLDAGVVDPGLHGERGGQVDVGVGPHPAGVAVEHDRVAVAAGRRPRPAGHGGGRAGRRAVRVGARALLEAVGDEGSGEGVGDGDVDVGGGGLVAGGVTGPGGEDVGAVGGAGGVPGDAVGAGGVLGAEVVAVEQELDADDAGVVGGVGVHVDGGRPRWRRWPVR